MYNNIDVNKMVQQQIKENERIAKTMETRVVEDSVAYFDRKEVEAVSKTNIVLTNGHLYLTRYINSKVAKVEFAIDVKVVDIMGYFDVTDEVFASVSVNRC